MEKHKEEVTVYRDVEIKLTYSEEASSWIAYYNSDSLELTGTRAYVDKTVLTDEITSFIDLYYRLIENKKDIPNIEDAFEERKNGLHEMLAS